MRAELVEDLEALAAYSEPLGRARRGVREAVLQPGVAPAVVETRGSRRGAPADGRRPGRRAARRDRASVREPGRRPRPAPLAGPWSLARRRAAGARRARSGSRHGSSRRSSPARSVVLDLEGIRAASPWPGHLADAWPGGAGSGVSSASSRRPSTLAGGTFEDWLASKSKHFRSQVRRDRRRLDEAGASLSACENRGGAGRRSRGVRRAAPRPLGRARRIRRADGGRGADAPRGCPRARALRQAPPLDDRDRRKGDRRGSLARGRRRGLVVADGVRRRLACGDADTPIVGRCARARVGVRRPARRLRRGRANC